MTTLRVRHLAMAATLGLAVATAASSAGATTPPDGGAVVAVADAGDASQLVDLTPVRRPGSIWTETTTFALIGTDTGPGVSYDYSTEGTLATRGEVVAAQPDGSYDAHVTIESSSQTVASGGAYAEDLLDDEYYQELLGVPVAVTATGQNVVQSAAPVDGATLTAEHQAALSYVWELPQSTPRIFPDQPVGVGATWTIAMPSLIDGVDLPTNYTCRLISAVDGQYVVEFDSTVDFAQATGPSVGANTPDGTITAAGTVTGDVADPFRSTFVMHVTTDISLSDRSAEVTSSYDYWVEIVGAPA